jgi:pimeloyl-ACP methyl ester carboxylesterase
VSTPRTLELPEGVRRVMLDTSRGSFAALEAVPGTGVCERRPALLIPGFTGSKEDFSPVLGLLAAAGRRVVAIDMRGQYESPPAGSGGDYSLAALAADAAQVAASLAARDPSPDGWQDQVHLVGHSFGGLVAQEVALSGAVPVSSLTLMSSGPGALTGARATKLSWALAGLHGLTGADLAAAVKQLWDAHLEPEAVAEGTPPDVVAFLRTRMLRNCPLGLRSMAEALLSCPDRTPELAALDPAPLLVLYGENDDAWAPAIQEDMAERLGAERVCVPGAAHSPAVEAPATVASTLTAFWSAAEARQARSSSASASQGRRAGAAAEPSGQRAR